MTFNTSNAVFYMIDDQGYQGTCWPNGPDTVVTASHMVWDGGAGGVGGRKRTGIRIIPGNNPGLGVFTVADLRYNAVNDYQDQENFAQMPNDFAVIRLNAPHGQGWWGIDPTMGPPGSLYTSAGFPAQNFNGQLAVQQNVRFTLSQPTGGVQALPETIEGPGSSGGPTYLNDGVWNVVSIYVCQQNGVEYQCQLTPTTEAQIEQWMAQMGRSSFAQRCYYALLGRAPDMDGLQNWSATLLAQGLSAVAFGFVYSPEFIGGNPDISNDDFVTKLYTAFFNRAPDPTGFLDWTNALNNNLLKKEDVAAQFAESTEAINTCGRYGQA